MRLRVDPPSFLSKKKNERRREKSTLCDVTTTMFHRGASKPFACPEHPSYLLGLLAKIKCSICSYQLNF